jgi:putative PIN family toxin of toxin-antitoxin system
MTIKEIVIDTNIWVSYFLSGQTKALVKAVLDNHLTIYSTQILLDELENVLHRPKISRFLKHPVADYIQFHQSICTFTHIQPRVNDIPDPRDGFLFDLCLTTGARLLVTGDKALLELKQYQEIEIINWQSFKKATGHS